MDTLRGEFDHSGLLPETDQPDVEHGETTPPPGIGQDERRMQVRAYNFWASLLEDRNFPSIEDLQPELQGDFGSNSVLLDFSSGVENPGVTFLGPELAKECGAGDIEIERLSDVPPRSLLSRITDHYLQIIANQAPIGFEAEFVNQRGATILYRGILLPFSSDDDTIDFIYGVINWKEMADPKVADELLLEIDQALETSSPLAQKAPRSLSDWMGGATYANDAGDLDDEIEDEALDESLELPRPSFAPETASLARNDPAPQDDDWEPVERAAEPFELGAELELDLDAELSAQVPAADRPYWANDDDVPTFSANIEFNPERSEAEEDLADSQEQEPAGSDGYRPVDPLSFDLTQDPVEYPPVELEGDAAPLTLAGMAPTELAPHEMGLGDWLAVAREQVAEASSCEDRTRGALYEAIGRAWDFAIAAARDPEGFDELLEDAGIPQQERAPMTPVVKLVFGADYDKTRLTEYAAALMHAQRQNLGRGELAAFLASAKGGLKGVVASERRARRLLAGKPEIEQRQVPRATIARQLRRIDPVTIADIKPEGSEFGLVMIRRTESGEIEILGEVPQDIALIEKAARKLL